MSGWPARPAQVGERKGAVILGGISVGGMALLLVAGILAGAVGSAGGIASLISYPVLLAAWRRWPWPGARPGPRCCC